MSVLTTEPDRLSVAVLCAVTPDPYPVSVVCTAPGHRLKRQSHVGVWELFRPWTDASVTADDVTGQFKCPSFHRIYIGL